MSQITLERYKELTDGLKKLGFKILHKPARSEDNSRWNCNNETTIVVTSLGIYTRSGRTDDLETLQIIEELCPKGRVDFATALLNEIINPDEALQDAQLI
jgi:hypothetical protein